MSDVEARREARRRKILENSEKRLQKISGVQKRNTNPELEGFRSLQNPDEIYTENSAHRSLPISESSNIGQLPSQVELICRNSLLNTSSGTNFTSSPSKHSHFKAYRVPIIILIAFLVNILACFLESNEFCIINKMFIPLLCFEAVYLFYNQNEANDDFTKYLILFRSLPRYKFIWVVKYLSILMTVFRDVMVYFFVFVCILYFRNVFTDAFYISFVL